MKNYIALLSLLFVSTAFGQLRDSVFVDKGTYKVVYSEVKKQPLRVTYNVTCTDGYVSRAGLDFHGEDGIVTSTDGDYAYTDYDKGHLAPASDFNCTMPDLQSTFSYLNCALQNKYLNRGVWKSLEAYERSLAYKYKVSVEVIIFFHKDYKVNKNGTAIPDAFIKVITYGSNVEEYIFSNEKPKFSSFKKYREE